MKIRLDGKEEEINKLICGNDLTNLIRNKGVGTRIKSYSKFYPNQNSAQKILNQKSETGRVYIEIE